MPGQSEQATPPKTDHSRHENREHFENLVSKFAESFVFYRFHDFDTMSNSKLHVAYILNLRDILRDCTKMTSSRFGRSQTPPPSPSSAFFYTVVSGIFLYKVLRQHWPDPSPLPHDDVILVQSLTTVAKRKKRNSKLIR